MCEKTQHCIFRHYMCNGHKDCNDGSDEAQCGGNIFVKFYQIISVFNRIYGDRTYLDSDVVLGFFESKKFFVLTMD